MARWRRARLSGLAYLRCADGFSLPFQRFRLWINRHNGCALKMRQDMVSAERTIDNRFVAHLRCADGFFLAFQRFHLWINRHNGCALKMGQDMVSAERTIDNRFVAHLRCADVFSILIPEVSPLATFLSPLRGGHSTSVAHNFTSAAPNRNSNSRSFISTPLNFTFEVRNQTSAAFSRPSSPHN